MKIELSKRTLLFALGISIQLAAFFGDHAADIPVIMRFLAPDYFHATRAVERLGASSSEKLSKGSDEGFPQISKILKKRTEIKLGTNSWVTSISEINVLGSVFVDGKLATSVNWTFTCNPVQYEGKLADKGTDNWSFEALKSEVETLKGARILVFCFVLFFIGTAFDVIAFRMEPKEQNLTDAKIPDANRGYDLQTSHPERGHGTP